MWNNGSIPSIDEFYLVDFVDDIDPNLLQIGYILNDNEHAVAVYGIKRDAAGNPTDVTLSESTSTYYGTHFRTMTIPEFYSFYGSSRSSGGMYMYKYLPIYRNTDFVPEVTDIAEIGQNLFEDSVVTYPTYPTYTNEICTFAGDKASFAIGEVGHLIVINYNLDGSSMGDYDRIRLYKEGDSPTLVGTWTVAEANATLTDIWTPSTSFTTTNYPNPVDMENHAVVVSTKTSPLAAGKYYAVLSDGTNDSTAKTEFEVIDNDISSVVDNGTTYKFNLSNKIKACYFGTLNANSGDPYFSGTIEHPLTYEEELGKYVLIDKSSIAGTAPENLYIRMHTGGDYGTACVTKAVFPST